MGELAPKLLRRPPRGWQSARAFPVQHAISSHGYGGEGVPEIEMTMNMRVTWRVELADRAPYEFQEERSVPAWLSAGSIAGHGNRWYKVRVRPQYGLMPKLGVPCLVNPANQAEIWVDWDAAYKEHIPAWEQEARVRREVARREGRYDQVVNRITSPFAGKARPEDQEHVEARAPISRPAPTLIDPAEATEQRHRMQDVHRIQTTGRKTTATVVSCQATSRKLVNNPIFLLTFDIEGRHVVHEHWLGPMDLRQYQVGRTVTVWIDPTDPNAIVPGA
jgi:hypothetical protein